MTRGRRSAAALSVMMPVLPGARRQIPPPELGEVERRIWNATVLAMPAKRFRGIEGVLASFCAEANGGRPAQ